MRLSKKPVEQKPKPATNTASVVSLPAAATAAPPTPASADIAEELIAARAYEKWLNRGSPMGQDGEQDWFAAREELEQERLRWAAPEAADRNRI